MPSSTYEDANKKDMGRRFLARRALVAAAVMATAAGAAALHGTGGGDWVLGQGKAFLALGETVRAHDPVSFAVGFFFVQFACMALLLPVNAPMMILAGAFFGPFHGAGIAAVANTFGAGINFLAARFFFREQLRKRYGSRLDRIDGEIARHGGLYILTVRCIPMFPAHLTNLASGLTPMTLRTFIAASFLGSLPHTALYAAAGKKLPEIEAVHEIFTPLTAVVLLLLAGAPALLRFGLMRKEKLRAK